MSEKGDRPSSRSINEFLIRAGIRLRADNKVVATSILIMDNLLRRDIAEQACNYTLASAALMVSAKFHEDTLIRVRDIVNVSHRLLHIEEDALKIDSLLQNIRLGIARLEFVIARELNFDIDQGTNNYFQAMCLYLDSLSSWMPSEYEKYPIADSCFIMLRDCFICPNIIKDSSCESIALAIINIVLQELQLEVPHSEEWYKVFKSTNERRVRKLGNSILKNVYKIPIGE